jgi:hypothetical protein
MLDTAADDAPAAGESVATAVAGVTAGVAGAAEATARPGDTVEVGSRSLQVLRLRRG